MTSPPSNEPKKTPLRIRLPFATEAEFIERYGLNVTRGTLFIATRSPKPVDTALTFDLVLSDNSRLMRGEGLVQELNEDARGGRTGMLVRLTRVDARTKELIDRILALRPRSAPSAPPRPPTPPAPAASPAGATSLDLGELPRWLTAPEEPGLVEAPPERAPRPSVTPLPSSPTPTPAVTPLSPLPLPVTASATEAAPLASTTGEAPPSAVQLRAHWTPRRLPSAESGTAPAPDVRKLPEEDLVLGLDLGASHWHAAIFVEGSARLVPLSSEEGATALPAVVGVDPQGSLLTGTLALGAGVQQSAGSLDRLLGRRLFAERTQALARHTTARLGPGPAGDVAIELGARSFPVADLAAELMKVLRTGAETMLGCHVSRAVVCAPSWYSAHQRATLFRAATLAGLEVSALLNVPSAVAMTFGHGRGLARKRVLVFDWAVGAFGASVVEITGEDIEVVCSGGDELFLEPSGELGAEEGARRLIEQAAHLTRGILEAAGLQPQSIDEVLVTGPSSEAAAVRASLERLMGRSPRAEFDPAGAAAIGAALYGRSLVRRGLGKRGLSLFEVLSAPIGVAVEDGAFHKVLEQNTRLPAEKTLAVPARTSAAVSLGVFQGPSPRAKDNEYLGLVTATTDRDGDLDVRFSVAADGRLSLSARSPGGHPIDVAFDSSADDADVLARSLTSAVLGPSQAPRPASGGLLGGLRRFFGG